MASAGKDRSASQFFITLRDKQDHLDEKYTVFGNVAEGLDIVQKISEEYADGQGRPYKNIRIRHTIVLDDPFPDPPGLVVPSRSPSPSALVRQQDRERLADDEDIQREEERSADVIEEQHRAKEARSRAEVLEMLGDLPDADVKPPETTLFICKLNSVTNGEDLDIIFGRFGRIRSCEVVRDWKTGESLNYAFIDFESRAACEQAYFKMEGALIDDRRIHVDFSQSVSGLWNRHRRGRLPRGSSKRPRGR